MLRAANRHAKPDDFQAPSELFRRVSAINGVKVSRIAFLAYGVVAYIGFLVAILYAMGFVANLFVPTTIDGDATTAAGTAALINVVLLGIFAVQHTIMARPSFKRWWTQFVPKTIERSTFVLVTNLLFYALFWQWRPISDVIWKIDQPAVAIFLQAFSWIGWGIVFLSTFLIDHFELFGLKQVWLNYTQKEARSATFYTPLLYQYVRHPLMLGFIIAFWSTPVMTAGHLLFAGLTTAYIFIGIQFEERDLIAAHGEDYIEYKKRTSMIIPLPPRGK